MPLLDFLIIGAQKSATTYIHRGLMEHPNVYMPRKEVTFFEDGPLGPDAHKSLEGLFPKQLHGKTIGIKRPDYLSQPECPERIHKLIPKAKLIIVLRDPIDRAVSAYYHYVSIGLAPLKDINRGLIDIIRGGCLARYPRSTDIVEYGFYHRHLMQYLELFPREQLLVLLFEDIQSDPVGSLTKVIRFLELDSSHIIRRTGIRPARAVYSLTRLCFHRLRNRLLFTFDPKRNKIVFKNNFRTFRHLLYAGTTFVDKTVLQVFMARARPQLSAELKSRLAVVYRDDVSRLGVLLGRNLSHWKVFRRN